MNGDLSGTTGVLEIGGDASFAGDLSCYDFTAGDGATAVDLAFTAGMTFKPNRFTVAGDPATANVTLHPSVAGGTWNLVAMVPNVSGATVSGSDASKGIAILPSDSVDATGNVNWFFTDTRVHWDGSTPVTAEDDVVIDGGVSVTISAATEMKSLTLDPGSSLSVNAALDGTARILLNGHTLRVNMERPKSWPKGGALPANVIPGGTAEAPGKIVWKSGLVFLLR